MPFPQRTTQSILKHQQLTKRFSIRGAADDVYGDDGVHVDASARHYLRVDYFRLT